MITFRVESPVNLGEIAALLTGIPNGMERAAKNAISRTLRGGRQDVARRVGKRYTIPVTQVMKTVKLSSAGMTGEMKSQGPRNPSDKFLHRPRVRINPGPPGGVFLRVVSGQGGNLRHGFIQRATGGIYERVGKSRFPIRRFHSPSAPGMIAHPKIAPFVLDKMEERLKINLEHAASAIVGGYL